MALGGHFPQNPVVSALTLACMGQGHDAELPEGVRGYLPIDPPA